MYWKIFCFAYWLYLIFGLTIQCLNSLCYSYIAGVRSGKFIV